jgi:gliding-associated putative ABC transporter substrate-binding component GldG
VYLDGNFPPEFKRLQNETKQLLEEFSAYNSNIVFQFVNPFEKEEEPLEVMKKFMFKDMLPMNVSVTVKGKQTQEVVIPWAVVNYVEKTTNVQLLKNYLSQSTEGNINSYVQHLEYAFAEAINTVSKKEMKKIAFFRGKGCLNIPNYFDILSKMDNDYIVKVIPLDSISNNPKTFLTALNKFDLTIIPRPKEKFTEVEKQVIDQYIMHGGKTLWLVDGTTAEMNQLYNETGSAFVGNNDLNLTDMFFKYGFRISSQLIKDEVGTPLYLEIGDPENPQTERHNWKFAPYVSSTSNHPIVKNTNGVKFDFCSPIELLNSNIKKTVLLESSQLSKTIGTPCVISLATVVEEPLPNEYVNGGFFPVAALLEGSFISTYNNRVLPFKDDKFLKKSTPTKMIVISDGNVIKNDFVNKQPVALGYDSKSKILFGNKEFLLNCVNYLLDDNGLINIRSKDVDLPLLNKEEVYANYTSAQLITVGLPILILAIFGFLFTYLRKKRYSR